MSTITVTSKTGKQIELTNTGNDVCARFGDLTFRTTQTADGFESTFAVRINGRDTKLSVVLVGDDLARANALFTEMHGQVAAGTADAVAYGNQYAAIQSVMTR